MDGNRGEKAISSDEDTFFSLWFHSINLCCLRVGDNEDIAGAKKVDGANKADGADRVDEVDKIANIDKADRVDRKNWTNKANRVDKANRADRGRANRGGAVTKKSDGVDRDKVDVKKLDRANGSRTNTEEPEKPNGGEIDTQKPDGVDRNRADRKESDRANRDVEEPKDLSLENPRVEKQMVVRQTAIQLSLFSFYNIFYLFSPLPNQKPVTPLGHLLPHSCP